jgi:hypothetical protein
MELKEKQLSKLDLTELIIGIRYDRHFQMRGKIGTILDKILVDKNSPFGKEFFPRYAEYTSDDIQLLNDVTNNSLRLNSTDIIFKLFLNDKKEDLQNWFKNQAIHFIIEEIVKKYEIPNIQRIGIQYIHHICAKDVGTNVIQKIIETKKQKIEQFNISFGRKETTKASLTKKVNDYINKITKITHIDEQRYKVLFDYQYFFKPVISKDIKLNIKSFYDSGYNLLCTEFYPNISAFIPNILEEE